MSRPDGGPAFPVVGAPGASEDYPGMTLRDYFIAHAPAEPQPWFKPVMPSERPKPRWVSNDGKREFKTIRQAERDCGDDFYNANYEAEEQWCTDNARQRYIQWPAAWADAMLKERAK